MNHKHVDEAWMDATSAVRAWLGAHEVVERAVLAMDIHGRIRAILWVSMEDADPLLEDLRQNLARAGGPWWSGDVWAAESSKGSLVDAWAWEEGTPDAERPERLRLLERHRNRGAWFTDLQAPLWESRGAEKPQGPPVVVFYSFKGGLGRTTAIASFAIQRARLGERVAVLDCVLQVS